MQENSRLTAEIYAAYKLTKSAINKLKRKGVTRTAPLSMSQCLYSVPEHCFLLFCNGQHDLLNTLRTGDADLLF